MNRCGSSTHRAQFFETDTRGIRGENGIGFHNCLHGSIERLFGIEVLEDGFDDQIGAGHAVAVDVGTESRGGCATFLLITHFFDKEFCRLFHGGFYVPELAILKRYLQTPQSAPRRRCRRP